MIIGGFVLRDQRNFKKITVLTRKPPSYVRMLIYRTWPIQYVEGLGSSL